MLARRPTVTRSAGRLRPAFTLVEVLVVMAILVVLAGAGTVATMSYLANARIDAAKLKASSISKACTAYATANEGTWPAALTDLTNPADGRKPLLEGGDAAITDPWGKRYNMQIVTDNNGNERPVISTTTDDGFEIKWPDPNKG